MFGHDVKLIIIVNTMSVRTYGKADNLNHSFFLFFQNLKPIVYYECQHSLVSGQISKLLGVNIINFRLSMS